MAKQPKQKLKVLCLCAKGRNRSWYLADYLNQRGYLTRFGGIDDGDGNPKYAIIKPITQKDVNWADIIILVRKRLTDIFNRKFKNNDKRMIVLDVSDQKAMLPSEFAHLKELDDLDFQITWTYPQLREAIKPYLPLKK